MWRQGHDWTTADMIAPPPLGYTVRPNEERTMTRLILTIVLFCATGQALSAPAQSDRELIRQEETDRIDRERQELRERTADLERQLRTSREMQEKQERLIERLQRELKRLKQQGPTE